MKSYLDCPHHNVQQFTEVCLDCGWNVYTTKEEYLKYLREEAARRGLDPVTQEIRKIEQQLG